MNEDPGAPSVMTLLGRATGGIGAHVDTLTAELSRLGVRVDIVTDPLTADTFGWAGARRWWPVRPVREAASALLDWHRMMRLAGTVDVVHAHGTQAALIALPVVLRARPRPAFVVSLHNDLPPTTSALVRRVVGVALRSADLVTGASEDLTRLARTLGARDARTVAVASPRVASLVERPRTAAAERPGLRARLYEQTGVAAPPERPLVLTVSRVAPQKDLDMLVRAAGERGRTGAAPATWVVVGGGDDGLTERLRRDAASAGAPVHLVGPRDDVPEWLDAADVFALSSRWEARALVVQEAMAAGVPVVATDVGGIGQLVGDRATLVPSGDAPALARAVDELLAHPDRAQRQGNSARELALSWTGPADEARQWADVYRAVART